MALMIRRHIEVKPQPVRNPRGRRQHGEVQHEQYREPLAA
jgi:hypothetical protein